MKPKKNPRRQQNNTKPTKPKGRSRNPMTRSGDGEPPRKKTENHTQRQPPKHPTPIQLPKRKMQ